MALNVGAGKEKAEMLKKYLSEQKILIADSCAPSRSRLTRVLVELGAKLNQIIAVALYDEAIEEIKKSKPKVVICDYALGRRSGLELLQQQRAEHPDSIDSLFVLITGNSSQSAVAKAAEEDVDCFIIKPYTMDNLKTTFISTSVQKLFPSDYQKKIREGKELLFAGKPDPAIEVFKKASEMDPKPTLACFYLGQAEVMKKAMEEARGKFQKGLTFNKIHYKCLIGLYDSLMEQKDYKAAYEVVKRISMYFPANPKRLASVVRLAVTTKQFDDIEGFYKTFTDMESRSEEMIKYICAGMIVTAKFYLTKGFRTRGLEVLQKAAISAVGQTHFLLKCVETLCGFQQNAEAREILKRFPAGSENTLYFEVSRYLIEDSKLPARQSIMMAKKVIQEGHEWPSLFLRLMQRQLEVKEKEEAMSTYTKATTLFPNDKEPFVRLMMDFEKNQKAENEFEKTVESSSGSKGGSGKKTG